MNHEIPGPDKQQPSTETFLKSHIDNYQFEAFNFHQNWEESYQKKGTSLRAGMTISVRIKSIFRFSTHDQASWMILL